MSRNWLKVSFLAVLRLFPLRCDAQVARPFDHAEFEVNGRDGSIDEGATSSVTKPNLLFIMTDQQRWDAFGAVQNELKRYEGHVKIRTPNLDRLAASGVRFRNAYSASTSCGPSRATLRTGCTVQRTGVQGNKLIRKKYYNMMDMFRRKVESVTSIDQFLVDFKSYSSEYYGKWHLPDAFYYRQRGPDSLSTSDMYSNLTADYWPPGLAVTGSVITHDDFDFETATPMFSKTNWRISYLRELEYLLRQDGMTRSGFSYRSGQQENPLTNMPYDPIRLDPYFGTARVVKKRKTNIYGRNILSTRFSPTAVLGTIGVKAIDRLAEAGRPFVLTVSFNSPHPPMVASPEYLDYYYQQRSELRVPINYDDERKNSAYRTDNKGLDKSSKELLQGLTAVYYGLVEEVDEWVGHLLDRLDHNGLTNETIIVFTTDHGEMLGAHGLSGKGNLYEESIRVPLIMSFPGEISPGTVVSESVSHIDVFSTIMDYLRASYLDNSDGSSLRRFIDGESFNRQFDEDVVVVESVNRAPESRTRLSGSLGNEPNFMIRKGDCKLMLPKKFDSDVVDMMFDVKDDPGERRNLLGSNGRNANLWTIGKAEHLKALLVEWMQRNDGEWNLYSDNKYNMGEGLGDIREIRRRRSWRSVDVWFSDRTLRFGSAVYREGVYVRNEYLYIGRTNPGKLIIQDVSVQGADAEYFSLSKYNLSVGQGQNVRIAVAFRALQPMDIGGLDAYIRVSTNAGGVKRIDITGKTNSSLLF